MIQGMILIRLPLTYIVQQFHKYSKFEEKNKVTQLKNKFFLHFGFFLIKRF
jgi:hypothetical protein